MTEQQIATWLESHGYVETESSPWGSGWRVNFVHIPLLRGERVVMFTTYRGEAAELARNGVNVTWLVELDHIPEQPRGVPSLRYAHYLKHGRTA
jgi:hypothetical protein